MEVHGRSTWDCPADIFCAERKQQNRNVLSKEPLALVSRLHAVYLRRPCMYRHFALTSRAPLAPSIRSCVCVCSSTQWRRDFLNSAPTPSTKRVFWRCCGVHGKKVPSRAGNRRRGRDRGRERGSLRLHLVDRCDTNGTVATCSTASASYTGKRGWDWLLAVDLYRRF